MIREFPSIRGAAEYIINVAENKLRKKYTRSYISGLISGSVKRYESVLLLLGLRSERSYKCLWCSRNDIFKPRTKCKKCEDYDRRLSEDNEIQNSDSNSEPECEYFGPFDEDGLNEFGVDENGVTHKGFS